MSDFVAHSVQNGGPGLADVTDSDAGQELVRLGVPERNHERLDAVVLALDDELGKHSRMSRRVGRAW